MSNYADLPARRTRLCGSDTTSTCGTHGSTSLRGRAKSSTVFGTSRGSWKPNQDARSSACGRMAERSTFPANSTVIYNKREFGVNG